jgi:hypothetical protein
MKELLDEFICTVVRENRTITLTYCHPTSLYQSGEDIPTFPHLSEVGGLTSHSGTCVYETHSMKGTSKPIVQNFIVMVSCDMGGVIEYIHQKIGLTEEDFNDVNELIRNHSRIIAERVDQDLDL